MTRNDDDVFMDLSSILNAIAPPRTSRVTMRAGLVPESDVCDFEFDAVGPNGEINWLEAGGRELESLMGLVIELRNLYNSSGMTSGHSPWSACEIALDIAAQRISVEFCYD